MTLVQNGDGEGSLTVDHDNKDQVTLALKMAKVRQRKQLSPERKEQLSALLATARNSRQTHSRRALDGLGTEVRHRDGPNPVPA